MSRTRHSRSAHATRARRSAHATHVTPYSAPRYAAAVARVRRGVRAALVTGAVLTSGKGVGRTPCRGWCVRGAHRTYSRAHVGPVAHPITAHDTSADTWGRYGPSRGPGPLLLYLRVR